MSSLNEASDNSGAFRSPELLCRHRTRIVVVDVQEKLLPVISRRDEVEARIAFLLDVAAKLDVPAVVSEQYPQGLGPTVQEILRRVVSAPRVEKVRFSAAEALLDATGSVQENNPVAGVRDQFVLTGIETHICVLQTALDLVAQGQRVFVVADAAGARNPADHEMALNRMRDSGVAVCSAESVAFELCETAGTAEFRDISKLVRQADSSRVQGLVTTPQNSVMKQMK